MTLKKMSKRSLTSKMDGMVKQMLKLIEDDGDSFAKKAEMYYQKRPELVSLVEEFYRGYRSLAERYEYATGDANSDIGSEPSSSLPSPSPRKMVRRISTNRAAGFDFFLGSAGNENGIINGSDSGEESDDDSSSVNNFSGFAGNGGGDHGVNYRRIIELELELREVKEKLRLQEEELEKMHANEQELRNVKEKLRLSEEEISKLKIELEKYKPRKKSANLFQGRVDGMDHNKGLKSLGEERIITEEKLESSEMKIGSLQDQVNLAKKEIAAWKTKFNSERKVSNKIRGEIEVLKAEIKERENDVKGLNVSLEALQLERDNLNAKIGSLREEVNSRDKQNEQLERHLKELQMEHVEVICGMEETHRQVLEELKSRGKQLEEEKREAIRQLCFSLEHYRDRYNILRQAFTGNKRVPVLVASLE